MALAGTQIQKHVLGLTFRLNDPCSHNAVSVADGQMAIAISPNAQVAAIISSFWYAIW